MKTIKTRRVIIGLMFIWLTVSCKTKKEDLTISVTVHEADKFAESVLYLKNKDTNIVIDSAYITKIPILFTHKIQPKTAMFSLVLKKKGAKRNKNLSVFFIKDKDVDVSFSFNKNKYKVVVKSEDKNQQDFQKFKDGLVSILKKRKAQAKKWRAFVKTGKHRDSVLRKPMDSIALLLRKKERNYYTNYVAENENLTALYLIKTELRFAYSRESLENILEKYPKTYIEANLYKVAKEKIQILKNTEIGSLAPDFTIPDVNGTPVSLSSFRGKYVLLDFWASWCGPCRAENPHVLEAYNIYNSSGFEVLGVSYDYPGMRKKWLKAIKDDGLRWTQVSNVIGWKDPTAKQYNISGIPAPFLIDPEGKIIAKGYDIRGDKLLAKLSEIFKDKKNASDNTK